MWSGWIGHYFGTGLVWNRVNLGMWGGLSFVDGICAHLHPLVCAVPFADPIPDPDPDSDPNPVQNDPILRVIIRIS